MRAREREREEGDESEKREERERGGMKRFLLERTVLCRWILVVEMQ